MKFLLFLMVLPLAIFGVLPCTESAIDTALEMSLSSAQEELDRFLAVPLASRNFDNTVRVFDHLKGRLIEASMNFESVVQIHPEKKIRNHAEKAYQKLNETILQILSDHPEIYDACLAVETGRLSEEERYYLTELLSDFRLQGMELGGEERTIFKNTQNEIMSLCTQFERQIAENLPVLYASQEDLAGLEDDWISSKKQNDGRYRLECDLPTYTAVMTNCTVRETRVQMYEQFFNRAYPENEETLKRLIAKRESLAKQLGFSSFSSFSLSSQMVQSPERAEDFLQKVRVGAAKKAASEIAELKLDQLERYDQFFMANEFKKKHFSVDQSKVAEYFPMEKTIEGLMHVYEQFFGLSIREVSHDIPIPDMRALELREQNGNLLGIIYLDLFPREGKTSHSGIHFPLRYAYASPNEPPHEAVSLIIGNFTKPTENRPSLMMHQEVITFFHEFGHAIHNMLGRSQFLCGCGTRVKWDFVELPSQLLEEWMWDPEILKLVSSHYITKEPLPDALIENMVKARFFGIGLAIQRACFLSEFGLALFNEGEVQDPSQLMAEVWKQEVPQIALPANDHFYASWWHLTGYGPRYYGYLWSQVFAVDLFEEIRKEGLLNPAVGRKYTQTIIGKGGSRDPNELLFDFLERAPILEPFFNRLR